MLHHLALPAFALGFTLAATVSRLSRSAMLEVISQDYIRTARAKGQVERVVVYKHALRNMMVPLLTIIGIFVAIALTGTVLTETVFTRPGLGKMLVDAIGARDYPLAQGAITVFTMTIIVVNLVVDMLYAVVDPADHVPVARSERRHGHLPRQHDPRPGGQPARGRGERAARGRSARRWLPIGIGALHGRGHGRDGRRRAAHRPPEPVGAVRRRRAQGAGGRRTATGSGRTSSGATS